MNREQYNRFRRIRKGYREYWKVTPRFYHEWFDVYLVEYEFYRRRKNGGFGKPYSSWRVEFKNPVYNSPVVYSKRFEMPTDSSFSRSINLALKKGEITLRRLIEDEGDLTTCD